MPGVCLASVCLSDCRVRQWVEGLLWERQAGGPDVFRIKGVLCVATSPRQHVLQVSQTWPRPGVLLLNVSVPAHLKFGCR